MWCGRAPGSIAFTVRADVFGGKPIVRDMRVAVEQVLEMLAAGGYGRDNPAGDPDWRLTALTTFGQDAGSARRETRTERARGRTCGGLGRSKR